MHLSNMRSSDMHSSALHSHLSDVQSPDMHSSAMGSSNIRLANMHSPDLHASILMVAPSFYEVAYRINPFMCPKDWRANHHAIASEQWQSLWQCLTDIGANILVMPGVPGLPDLVFAANAGIVLDGKVLLSRFKHHERTGETPHFARFFQSLQSKDMTIGVATDTVTDDATGISTDTATGITIGAVTSVATVTNTITGSTTDTVTDTVSDEEIDRATAAATSAITGITTVAMFPEPIIHEGAGDCIWDPCRKIFWAGYGKRSDKQGLRYIQSFFQQPVIPLRLVTEHYYHLDTCFTVLSGGEVLYFPGAFAPESLAVIEQTVAPEQRIVALPDEAIILSLNMVNLGRDIVMHQPSQRMISLLTERGYNCIPVNLSSFIMSGGAACCMTLKLGYLSA